jgi:hypothetical protein
MALDKDFLSCQLAGCVGKGSVDDDAAQVRSFPAAVMNARRSSVGYRAGHAPCRVADADLRDNLGLFLYPSAS